MKFEAGKRRRAGEYEKDWVAKWQADKTFEKSVEQRPKSNAYVFYDGPPFISGVPHHGTLLSSIVKDAVPRYQTMKGKRVERVWGWDAHGLPAERYTEKKLGINSRQEVIEYGIENYINATRENMLQTSSAWEDVIDRIGRWVDFKGAYKTMDKDYMESIWWAFKTLYEKGKIYEGEKVLMYCTLDATPLSKAEVTMDAGAYQDVTDPSVYVKFKLKDYQIPTTNTLTATMYNIHDTKDKQRADMIDTERRRIVLENQGAPVYLLAWTTTPWTLLANTALAVNEHETYSLVYANNEFYIVGETLLGDVLVDDKNKPMDYTVIRSNIFGKEFVDLDYEPLFVNRGDNAHKVWHADYVTHEKGNGTGVVHIAPAYGEEDFALARSEKIPVVHTIDENGYFTEGVWQGRNVWNINKQIAKDMNRYSVATLLGDYAKLSDDERMEFHKTHEAESDASIWKVEYIKHSYPHCHRCGTKLMYRAHPSWFMDIDGQRTKMLEKNEPINWFPAHVKHGRFEKTVLQAPDWNISRDRFWATAMPVWKTDYEIDPKLLKGKKKTALIEASTHKVFTKVFGSYEELENFSGKALDDYHRPWIDEVKFHAVVNWETEEIRPYHYEKLSDAQKKEEHPGYDFPKENVYEFTRIDKVMDSWFEAGSMPFAQFHYPFENKEKFEQNFPGDFIVEYIGQVRAWFYYMHAMSVALFGENSFKNVIVTGNVAGNDGRKMSKSYGNFTDPQELMDKFSADSLRFLLLSSPLLNGEDFALQDKEVGDVARKLGMIWNMYDFFTMYAEVDGWEFDGNLVDPLTGSAISSETASRPLSVDPPSADNGAADVSSDTAKPVTNPLDIWIISRLHQLVAEVVTNMDDYNIPDALSPILPFLDDASNWFVRRSRRRFWKSGDDDDKQMAYKTLHYVLVRLSYVLAPFTPFLAEELYQNLTGDSESIHLKDWLPAGNVNELVMNDMETVRDYVNQGLSLRAKAKLKVRQPLASVTVPKLGEFVDFASILKDELNVKTVEIGDEVALDEKITPELKREGLMREVIRHVQSARKQAGLNVDDRIKLSLTTSDDELAAAIKKHGQTIASETLASTLETGAFNNKFTVKVEGAELHIALQKA